MKSGWVTKKLGDVCEITAGNGAPQGSDNFSESGDRCFLRVADMGQLHGMTIDSTRDRLSDKPKGLRLFPSGSVVFTKSGASLLLNQRGVLARPMHVVSHIGVLIPSNEISSEYLYYWMCIVDFGRLVKPAHMPALRLSQVANLDIPIPPLAEQKRIVAKIDAAFEKIDALKANAEKNLANAKELFQSALDEAMRPKPGWVEKRLGEIGSVCMCKRILKSETNTERGVPFYKIGTFGKTANAYISQETFDRYRKLYKFPRKGEILISAAGTIGRAVTYDGAPAYFQDSNIVWVANDEKEVLNQYLKWFYMTAPWHVTKGATIQRLYNENIESAQIAYPPLSVQKQVCQSLDTLFEKTETLQQNYARQIADCAEMRQAILREAFEGKL